MKISWRSLILIGAMALSLNLSCSAATILDLNHRMLAQAGRLDLAPVAAQSFESNLSAAELSLLAKHDIVLFIDKSDSMSKADCSPHAMTEADSQREKTQKASVSRWRWCEEEAQNLTEKVREVIPDGLTVVVFSGRYVVYDNVDARNIAPIFSKNKPQGNTDTASALKDQLDKYFERRERTGGKNKDLLVAVVTDGCPNVPTALRLAIVEATQKMTKPEEISIAFLQIGNDVHGKKILSGLDTDLVNQNAKFDIVGIVPFDELSRIGLAHALANQVAQK